MNETDSQKRMREIAILSFVTASGSLTLATLAFIVAIMRYVL